jgi:hypothetical protein
MWCLKSFTTAKKCVILTILAINNNLVKCEIHSDKLVNPVYLFVLHFLMWEDLNPHFPVALTM